MIKVQVGICCSFNEGGTLQIVVHVMLTIYNGMDEACGFPWDL
jgi:hypothetical protein